MKKYLSFLAIGSAFLFACQSNKSVEIVKDEVDTVVTVMEKEGLRLSTNNQATEFDNAMLSLLAPDTTLLDSGLYQFRFNVQNYELGIITSDILSGQCANSGDGQHIHFIMNNEPYSAQYKAEFEEEIGEGHNVLLAFLSRSYHMGVKNENAFVLKEFSNNNAEDNFDETAPHLFYSRPKGEYIGKDARKVMLDFYLLNTNLVDNNYSITATINGVPFEIKTWEPYFIEGLKEGDNTINLALKDEAGKLVKSPFNPVERTIKISLN